MDISLEKSFEFFIQSLEKCGSFLLDENKLKEEYYQIKKEGGFKDYNGLTESQEMIGYYIFEEFDSDIAGSLSDYSLNLLKESNLISEEIFNKCKILKEDFYNIQSTLEWDVKKVSESMVWKNILLLSDEIKLEIYQNNKSIFKHSERFL